LEGLNPVAFFDKVEETALSVRFSFFFVGIVIVFLWGWMLFFDWSVGGRSCWGHWK
jgi:hypothetical protein